MFNLLFSHCKVNAVGGDVLMRPGEQEPPPPLLLSFERFTSLNPVSQHNHALLAPLLFFRTHFGRSSCDLHGNGREMQISLSKEGKRKTKGG